MKRNQFLYRAILIFGIAVLFTSVIDFVTMALPPKLYSPEWVYYIVEMISEKAIIPVIALLAILAGLCFEKSIPEKVSLLSEKILSIVSIGFCLQLIIAMVFWGLVFTKVEDNSISKLKNQADAFKKQTMNMYVKKYIVENQINVQELSQEQGEEIKLDVELDEEVKQQIEKIDKNLNQTIKQKKTEIKKNNVKILLNLLSFLIVYLFIGVFGFLRSSKDIAVQKFSK